MEKREKDSSVVLRSVTQSSTFTYVYYAKVLYRKAATESMEQEPEIDSRFYYKTDIRQI